MEFCYVFLVLKKFSKDILMKMKKLLLSAVFVIITSIVYPQIEPLWLQDTSFVRELYLMRSKFSNLSFNGYVQTQYQHAASEGIECYNGGDFAKSSNNRFMIRRGMFRLDYENKTNSGYNKYYFVMQFSGTEKGVSIRDIFGRIYENKWNYFVITAGIFNRPFGYELNYYSSLRESPERGRMSQILMKIEKDIGVMISFEPQDRKRRIYPLKLDAGIFNGQGLTGPYEFDSFKDIIAHASIKRISLNDRVFLSGGISYLKGGFRNNSGIFFRTIRNNDNIFVATSDSSLMNIGKISPRIYYGADLQIVFKNFAGSSEIRGEFITGTQSATYNSSETPGTPPLNGSGQSDAIFVRNFKGGYFYLIHSFSEKHKVVLKYDFYDPNNKIISEDIQTSSGFSPADIRYDTWGAGYIYYLNNYVKLILYYDHPVNEKTLIPGYLKDLKDDTFTARLQFRF